jgi:hypothetical protein
VLPHQILENIESMLDYLYPHLKGQWVHDKIRPEEQFQNSNTHTDCGFHMLAFVEAALKDRQISIHHAEFDIFKERIELQLEAIQCEERQIQLAIRGQAGQSSTLLQTATAPELNLEK